jgi:hypothetical protein
MKEVRPQTGTDDAMRHQPFDWAMDIDQLIGPVPSASDFRPTMPSQPIRTPPAPTDCNPTAPMSPQDVPAPAKPDRTPTKTTAASITGETAPHTNAAHSPTSLAKPGTDRRQKGLGKPPSPLVSPQPAPSPRARDLCSNQQGHVTASKHHALPEPAVTPPSDDMAPCVRTPATVHGPQDLMGLRSDAPNPCDLGLTNIASSMSQIAVVILNWIIQSVFQEDYTGPFIQTPFSSLFEAVIQYNQNNGFAYICLGSYW